MQPNSRPMLSCRSLSQVTELCVLSESSLPSSRSIWQVLRLLGRHKPRSALPWYPQSIGVTSILLGPRDGLLGNKVFSEMPLTPERTRNGCQSFNQLDCISADASFHSEVHLPGRGMPRAHLRSTAVVLHTSRCRWESVASRLSEQSACQPRGRAAEMSPDARQADLVLVLRSSHDTDCLRISRKRTSVGSGHKYIVVPSVECEGT
ncbi:hypothetical protein C8Q77DRAFT_551257 [Trametes polyzona]|nr:hypothetical protein C8Q77DRAFT_551257 [Trametes polyzona]